MIPGRAHPSIEPHPLRGVERGLPPRPFRIMSATRGEQETLPLRQFLRLQDSQTKSCSGVGSQRRKRSIRHRTEGKRSDVRQIRRPFSEKRHEALQYRHRQQTAQRFVPEGCLGIPSSERTKQRQPREEDEGTYQTRKCIPNEPKSHVRPLHAKRKIRKQRPCDPHHRFTNPFSARNVLHSEKRTMTLQPPRVRSKSIKSAVGIFISKGVLGVARTLRRYRRL